MSFSRRAALLIAALPWGYACAAVLGVDDIGYARATDAGAADSHVATDASFDSGTDGATGIADGGSDNAVACTPDLPSVHDNPNTQYATCGSEPSVDLFNRSDHCGRCGHSCVIQNDCVNGYCVPVPLTPLNAGEGTTTFVEGGYVYWVANYTLGRTSVNAQEGDIGEPVIDFPLPEAGDPVGEYILHAADRSPDSFFVGALYSATSVQRDGGTWRSFTVGSKVEGVVADPLGLAFTAPPAVARVDLAGNKLETLSNEPGQVVPHELVRSRNNLLWTVRGDGPDAGGSIKRHDGNTGHVLALDAGFPTALATDGEYVYWGDSSSGRVWRLSESAPASTAPELVAEDGTLPYVLGIAVDATHVYWIAALDLYQAVLFRRAKCGGAISVVTSLLQYPHGLVTSDDGFLFYTTINPTQVQRVAK